MNGNGVGRKPIAVKRFLNSAYLALNRLGRRRTVSPVLQRMLRRPFRCRTFSNLPTHVFTGMIIVRHAGSSSARYGCRKECFSLYSLLEEWHWKRAGVKTLYQWNNSLIMLLNHICQTLNSLKKSGISMVGSWLSVKQVAKQLTGFHTFFQPYLNSI